VLVDSQQPPHDPRFGPFFNFFFTTQITKLHKFFTPQHTHNFPIQMKPNYKK
jgi:hypothetical protein